MPLFDQFQANASADIVAIFDADFRQVFPSARPIKANIKEVAKLMKHPIETGGSIADHIVYDAIEIEFAYMVVNGNFRSAYQQIKQLYKSGVLLTVQTKSGSYPNMVITAMPHDEDPALYDALAIAVKLEEADFITPQFGTLPPSVVRDQKMSDTVKKGEQQTTLPTAEQTAQTGVLYQVFNNPAETN